jgi:hypothetical protein
MMPNIIIHPTRHNGIASTMRCFGRVMMSVRRIEKRERETPVDKLGVDGVGVDRCPAPNKVVQRWV